MKTAGVIATYNQRAFVYEAVVSLLTQVDELVVVDDASTDGTLQILKSISAPQLKLISHTTNRGVSESYNEAVHETSCDVILIQGGDDVSRPGRANLQAGILESSEVVLVYSDPIVIDAASMRLPDWAAPEFFKYSKQPDPFETLYFEGNYICAPSVAMRKSDFTELGGFPSWSLYFQDFSLWLNASQSGTFRKTNDRVVRYRKHATNLSKEQVGPQSGADASRFLYEFDSILANALSHLSKERLEHLAAKCGVSISDTSILSTAELEVVIELNHPNESVVRCGLNKLSKLGEGLDKPNTLSRLGIGLDKLNFVSEVADERWSYNSP